MSIVHQFSIDGQIVTVPEEELEEFLASMDERGITPEKVSSFETDDGEILDIPDSEREEFEQSFGERQIPIRNIRRVMMDDGKELNLGEEDIRQFVQARQTGMPMSRGLLANTGIPDWYGKSREDREALADKFAAMFPLDDGPKPDYLPRERNLGDAITDKLNDGSLESEMLVGGMKAAGRIAKNVASTVPIVADAVGNLTDTEFTRPISGYAKRIAQGSRDFMDAIDTEAEPIVTGDPEMDEKLTSFRDTFGGTLEAVGGMTAKSLLGVVPAEIAALGVNKAFDVAKDAMNKGMPAQKAIAMGVADGLLEYGKNKVLFGGGQRAVVENGLKSALKGMLGAVGKYTAAAGVQNVIEQGAQTDENGNFKANPDLVETMKAMGEEAKDIALYEAVNRGAGLAASGVFDRGQRKAASDARRAAQEREEASSKEVAREEARTRYEANLSEEARSDIENRVNDMVKTGVIPSYRHAQEVERIASEKLGSRERGESTERVEQAVMEAAQEVAERLATPERVTSAALERRQTESQMRENEFNEASFEKELEDLLAKRHDNSSEKAAMDEADVAAREAETARRKADYEAALADYDAKLAKADAVRKKGGKSELPETPTPTAESPSSMSAAFGRMTDAINEGLRGGRATKKQAYADAEIRRIAGEMADTNDQLPTDAEIDAIVSSIPETKRGIVADKFRKYRDWVAEHRETAEPVTDKPAETDGNPTPPELRVEENKKPVIEADLTENKTTRTYKAKGDDVVPNGMNTRLGLIREDVAAKIADIDPNIKIVGIDFHGSRLRGDNRKDSDLDAVVEFKGDWSESSVFDALHGKDILTIDGVKVDINPIRADKTGNLEDYMRQSRQYDFSKEFEKGAVGVGEGTKKSDLSKKTAQVGKETGENAEIGATNAWKGGEIDKPISEMSIEELRKAHLEAWEKRIEANHAQSKLRDRSIAGDEPTNAEIEEADAEAGKWFRIEEETLQRLGELQKPKPTNVPDGRGRMVDKPSWRTSKVDEVDADGKPYTEAEKMQLRQDKAMTFIDETFKDSSRKNLEAAIKAFEDIESEGGFGKDSSGASPVSSVRRVAHQIATSNFATPEEKARFKKYYEGEPQPPQPRENAPSRAPLETKPMSRPEAEKPVDARNGASDDVHAANVTKIAGIVASQHGMEVTDGVRKTAEKVATAIENKDAATLKQLMNGLNKGVVKAFTEITGIKMPRTQKGQRDFIDKFCNGEVEQSPAPSATPIDKANAARAANVDAANAPIAKMETAYIQDQRAALLSAQQQGDKSKSTASKIAAMEAELNRRGEPLEQRKTVADDATNPEAIEWAKKSGFRVGKDGRLSPSAVDAWRKNKVHGAVRATKNLFKDANVEVVDREWNDTLDGEGALKSVVGIKRANDIVDFNEKKMSGLITTPAEAGVKIGNQTKEIVANRGEQVNVGVKYLRSDDGRVVGTFDPATKKIRLYRGADESTVYHELIGHGVYDWAERNDAKLLSKLDDLATEAPKEIIDEVKAKYGEADAATVAKEIVARIAQGKGLENIKPKDAPKNWFAKAYVNVKDALIRFAEKMGFNRINLRKMDEMSPLDAMDYLTKQIAKGKTLGRIGDGKGENLSRMEKIETAVYDRHAPLKTLSYDAFEAKTLQPGMEADFEARIYRPKQKEFTALLNETGFSAAEVGDYMKAVAARERNQSDRADHVKRLIDEGKSRAMAERETDLLIEKLNNGTSGISDERIDETIRHYETLDNFKDLKRVADFLWDLQKKGLEERVRSGLVSRSEADEWTAREPHHVPFKSAIDETTGDHSAWSTSARNMSGSEFARHYGRFSESGDPVTFIWQEFGDAHIRAIENDARRVLANAALKNPNIGRITTDPTIRESRVKGDGGNEYAVNFKEIGKDGKTVVRSIILSGERGRMAASSYTNRELKKALPGTQWFMHKFWAPAATEWSPLFAGRNLVSDNQDVSRIVMAEYGTKEGGKWLKDYAKNFAGTSGEIQRYARNGDVGSGSVLERYMKSGAMIGGFSREGYADLADKFSVKNIERELKKGQSKSNILFRNVKALNTYAELITRVSAFKTCVDRGMSDAEAAKFSREISVDFNRKGNYTPVLNNLFLFSNSTIGAKVRQVQAIRKAASTKEGRRVLAALAVGTMAKTILSHYINDDEDKKREAQGLATGKDIPEHTKKVSTDFRYGGTMFRIPKHEDPLGQYEYYIDAITRATMFGDKQAQKELAKDGIALPLQEIPAFLGIGSKNMDAWKTTFIPDAYGLKMVGELLADENFYGKGIKVKNYTETQPDSHLSRKSTGEGYKWIAEHVNEWTGGDAAHKGKIDISPEVIKHVVEGVTKNVGKDVMGAIDLGLKIAKWDWEQKDKDKLPGFKTYDGNDNRYFEAVNKFRSDKDGANKLKFGPGERKDYMKERPYLRVGSDGRTQVDFLMNGDRKSGVLGINDLRHLENGEKRVYRNGTYKWVERDTPPTKDQIEKWKSARLRKQAKVIEIMGL